jgi:NAD(P)H-hydrate epimerase
MKILSAEQIRNLDAYTIKSKEISSIELMEQAATECFRYIVSQESLQNKRFLIYCGVGNNGGDGLAIARMLHAAERPVEVHILGEPLKGSPDFQINLTKLQNSGIRAEQLTHLTSIQNHPNQIIIDAIFGSGLNKPVKGLFADLIEEINASGVPVISIDIPSGLFCDAADFHPRNPVVKATVTLTFHAPKLSFMFPESGKYTGKVEILDIGLDAEYAKLCASDYYFIDKQYVAESYSFSRSKFSHKGNFGHGYLAAGEYGKAGAAILSAAAALRSGIGLLTVQTPERCVVPVQSSIPEAMVIPDSNPERLSQISDFKKYTAIALGPGIGVLPETAGFVESVLSNSRCPLVIDADALNIISAHPEFFQYFSERIILTPHPKEFDRLFGQSETSFDRLKVAVEAARKFKITIVLKGAHTATVLPDGSVYFNGSGNPGMATAGSGDVLTGILLSMLCRGMKPKDAAICGVYVHGLAGDFAALGCSQTAMKAGDIVEGLKQAFSSLE